VLSAIMGERVEAILQPFHRHEQLIERRLLDPQGIQHQLDEGSVALAERATGISGSQLGGERFVALAVL
jgi:hypothetical protein